MSIFTDLFGTPRPNASLNQRIESLARDNRQLFAELEAAQQRFGRFARGTWRVQEDERRHIARELHDHLGQTLTTLVHRLERLGDDEAGDCMALARQALQDTRELSRILRPPVLDDLGICAALEWLGRRTGEATGIGISIEVDALPERPDPDLESLLFRIAQECLNNVVKHARAHHVGIALKRSGDRLALRIRDDGIGFDPDAVSADRDRGIGLEGMRDRVRLFGGDIAIISEPGRGTAVTVSVTGGAESAGETTQ